jgi:hypothetical protein
MYIQRYMHTALFEAAVEKQALIRGSQETHPTDGVHCVESKNTKVMPA